MVRDDYNFIKAQDEEVYAAIVGEEEREIKGLELIPSENYVSQLARELGGSLEDVARANIEKLAARKERGVLHGSGDNR